MKKIKFRQPLFNTWFHLEGIRNYINPKTFGSLVEILNIFLNDAKRDCVPSILDLSPMECNGGRPIARIFEALSITIDSEVPFKALIYGLLFEKF